MKYTLNLSKQLKTVIHINEDIILNDNHYIYITDQNLYGLYKDSFLKDKEVICLSPGEESKSFNSYLTIISYLIEHHISKDCYLVGFGGGVISDLVSFVASTYKRGIGLILIPTSLLAMVDASIGGKNGLNYNNLKNVIGSIYLPKDIYINLDFLKTLPNDEFISGLGEILKIGLLFDEEIFSLFYQNKYLENLDRIIIKAIKYKVDVVKKDPFETGYRRCLNFGHTFGHAFERLYGLKHGYSVMIGMLIISNNKPYYQSLKKIVNSFDISFNQSIDINQVLNLIENDKKFTKEGLIIVDVESIGNFSFKTITKQDIKQYLEDFINE